jgi:nucleoside-diphosphate-sugar epimerase
LTARDLLDALAGSFNRPSRTLRVPRALVAAAAFGGELMWLLGRPPLVDFARLAELRAEGFVCSVDRARELLGFTAKISLRDGIAQTARWYEREGWI